MFTAHPTEAVRRALLEKEQEIVSSLVADIDRSRTPPERRADRERMRMALTAGWQTAEAPVERPSVADELEHVGFYLSDVLYRVLPVFYEVFEDALAEQPTARRIALPPVLRFGSWVGGDMDGNPNVGAETIAATLATQRALVLAAYRRDLRALGERAEPVLVARGGRRRGAGAHRPVRAALARTAAARLKPRHADMPYRHLLSLMTARLQATANDKLEGYADAASFLADLDLIEASLRAHRGEHAGGFALRRLRRRVEAFGFHLATLDLRQDSAVHDAGAVGAARRPGLGAAAGRRARGAPARADSQAERRHRRRAGARGRADARRVPHRRANCGRVTATAPSVPTSSA